MGRAKDLDHPVHPDLKPAATVIGIISGPEIKDIVQMHPKPRADWKNDLQTYEESRKLPK